MKDISPELLRDIQDTYSKLLEKNTVIAGIKKKIESKTINYNDAFEYACQSGEAYAAAFKKVLNSEALPDGKMYWNIAQSVVKPTLEEMYDKVADVAQITQKQLNEAANIGIKALRVTNKEDRIEGLLNRLASEETYDDISWILDRPVVTMAQSVIDDSVKINSEFQYKAGMKPKIIRTAAGGCCKWCTARAGIFIYPDVPKDIYRRHENCNCTVVYNPGEGKKYQNVWSKEWKNAEEYDKIEKRKQIGLSQNISGIRTINKKVDQDERFVIQPDKINKFLLKPGAKHSKEFFDVGYSSDDHVKLYKDIAAQFDMEKAEYDEKSKFGQGFSIDMQLGITKKRTFKTVWQIEKEGDKPRLITAHRRR